MIEPRPDPYGRYADSSALADYLEVLALAGVSPTRHDLADQIADNTWTVRAHELFLEGGEERDSNVDDEEGVIRADRVFRLLDERSRTLGHRYPFDITETSLMRRPPADEHRLYYGLLAISLAHAYGLYGDVTGLFEEVVAAALSDRGLRSIRISSAGANFEERVTNAGTQLDLSPTPEAEIRRLFAHDEKGDVLTHFGWTDLRVDTWTAVGQVTCAVSEEWDGKIAEPSDVQWKGYLNVHPRPLTFLAIPHHAESRHRHWLTKRHERLLLDRLRLVACRTRVVEGEDGVVAAVTDAEWFSPFG